ncbi:hypothetical protein [Embleya scabrispora]|uniref:hypothetical protein n=1 Tax=Embleya scabrispora TaxID=159449 RepID=UPI00039A31DE|nr:hypothetical protein [Embleya scabrispora]MYS83167.1 hypothetical protein [Streptomyces sp. SID5474]
MRRAVLGMTVAALIAVGACGPAEDKDAKAEPSATPSPTHSARPGEIRDPKAHISYVLPQGWYPKPPDAVIGLYSSVASTVDPKTANPAANPTANPTAGPTADPKNPLGTFMVGVVDTKVYVSKPRSMPEMAETVGRTQLELIYPAKAQDSVRSSEAARLDGRNAWLMDIECTPEDKNVAPFRLRVTVIDTGAVPIYMLSSAPSSATERFGEIESIERSVRF